MDAATIWFPVNLICSNLNQVLGDENNVVIATTLDSDTNFGHHFNRSVPFCKMNIQTLSLGEIQRQCNFTLTAFEELKMS